MQCFYSSIFLSHVLRNFIEDVREWDSWRADNPQFLSHVLRNFIEESNATVSNSHTAKFLSHVLRNFIEDFRPARPCLRRRHS